MQADQARKLRWTRENPLTIEQKERITENRREGRARIEEVHATGFGAPRSDIAWTAQQPPALTWLIRIAVPFQYTLSKNHIYTMTRYGHTALRREARASRDEITQLLREAVRDRTIKNNKLWIDIFVEKPNHRGDAINVVDLVCDAIKDATGVDDRWYSIRCIDWQIVKSEPTIYIGIGQEECEDAIACSFCGEILPLAAFNKNRASKIGVDRRCRECLKLARKPKGQPS